MSQPLSFDPPSLLTCQEAAEVLRVEPSTIRRYIRTKRLAAVRIGGSYRIRQEDLHALIQPNYHAATTAKGD